MELLRTPPSRSAIDMVVDGFDFLPAAVPAPSPAAQPTPAAKSALDLLLDGFDVTPDLPARTRPAHVDPLDGLFAPSAAATPALVRPEQVKPKARPPETKKPANPKKTVILLDDGPRRAAKPSLAAAPPPTAPPDAPAPASLQVAPAPPVSLSAAFAEVMARHDAAIDAMDVTLPEPAPMGVSEPGSSAPVLLPGAPLHTLITDMRAFLEREADEQKLFDTLTQTASRIGASALIMERLMPQIPLKEGVTQPLQRAIQHMIAITGEFAEAVQKTRTNTAVRSENLEKLVRRASALSGGAREAQAVDLEDALSGTQQPPEAYMLAIENEALGETPTRGTLQLSAFRDYR